MGYTKTNFEADNISLSPLYSKLMSAASLPATVSPRFRDNRELCLPPNNQGQMPACTGYAVAGYLETLSWKHSGIPRQFDAQQIYAEAKKIDGVPTVAGSYIDSALKAAINLGYTKDIGPLSSLRIARIPCGVGDIKRAVHRGETLIAAFAITSDWNYVDTKGKIKVSWNAKDIGGHAVLIVGYNERGIWIQNSWGFKGWGQNGFAFLPWTQVLQQMMYGVQLI